MAATAEQPPRGSGPTEPPVGEQVGNGEQQPYPDIVARAREQGRETLDGLNLSGLAWQEGDVVYRQITGRVKLEEDREEVLKWGHVWSSTKGAGFHGEPTKTKPITTTTYLNVVKTWDRSTGDMTGMEELTDEELEQRFQEANQEDGPGIAAWRLPEPDTEALNLNSYAEHEDEYERLWVTAEDNENILEQIDAQRWEHKLPNWLNFTWNDENGRLYRIVEDEVLSQVVDGKKQSPERTWVIETSDYASPGRRHVVSREQVDGTKLRSTLRDVAKHPLTSQYMRFEVPGDLPTPERGRKRRGQRHDPVKREALRRRKTAAAARAQRETGAPSELPQEVLDNYNLSLDDATKLVSYHDVLGDGAHGYVKEMLEAEDGNEYYSSNKQDAESLQELVADVGKDRVFDLAVQLRNAYYNDARRLDLLRTDPSGTSVSWALVELARLHQYAKTNPGDAPGFTAGNVGVVDPFTAGGDQTRNKLREILDRRIGREFARRALKMVKSPEARGLLEVEDEQGHPDVKQFKGLKEIPRIDIDFTEKLQGFIKEKVLEGILAPVAKGEANIPDWPEWIVLGRLLRESVGN
jgi:hypothetical protein